MSTIKTNNLQHTGSADVNLALDSSGYVAIQDGAAGTPALYFSGDSNTGIYSPGADSVAISTGGTARATVDSSGRLLVGTSSDLSNYDVQIANANGDGFLSMLSYSSTASNGVYVTLNHSKSGTLGTHTLVSSGDMLGTLRFRGSDGSSFVDSAAITAEVDGTPGASDMPGRLIFSTTADAASSPTERMRITQLGEVTIGMGGGISSSSPGVAFDRASNVGRIWAVKTSSGTKDLLLNYHSGSYVGGITYSDTATAFLTSSDYRLKENVVPLNQAIDRVNALRPCRFNFIADPDTTVDGFIAHEAQVVVPECIFGEKDAINEDGSIKPQAIDQAKLVPLLTAALQEAIGEIEALKARVAALESA